MYVLYKGFYSFRIGNLISDHLWCINESSSDLAKAQPYLSQSFHLTVSSLLLCLSVCLSVTFTDPVACSSAKVGGTV